jgi:hypothetical protein
MLWLFEGDVVTNMNIYHFIRSQYRQIPAKNCRYRYLESRIPVFPVSVYTGLETLLTMFLFSVDLSAVYEVAEYVEKWLSGFSQLPLFLDLVLVLGWTDLEFLRLLENSGRLFGCHFQPLFQLRYLCYNLVLLYLT